MEKIKNEKTGENFSVEEVRRSARIQKSATPKGDLSWYIKWISSVFTLAAVTIRSSGIPELIWADMLLSWIGVVGWFVVGFLWKDRAILLLNGVLAVLLFSGLLRYYFADEDTPQQGARFEYLVVCEEVAGGTKCINS